MRILVTGVTGQVGAAVVSRFGELGTVVPADRSVLDLAQPREIAAALDRLSPGLIVNPAAYTAVDRAEDEQELAFRINGEAPKIIAQWAAGRGVPLIHFSTDYVFEGSGQEPWSEDAPTRALSVYGASKLEGESAVRAAGGPHLVVRTSWVYAAKGTNFLRTMTRLAGERPELRVVADQIGAPTSAAIIADGIASIIRRHATDLASGFAAANGLIHLSASGATSWHGFAQAIVDELKARGVPIKTERVVPIRTEDYPTKAVRPKNSRLSLDRLNRVYGVAPQAWDSGLRAEIGQMLQAR
jgi:dTDP-4-dehydrorhamnose reductase